MIILHLIEKYVMNASPVMIDITQKIFVEQHFVYINDMLYEDQSDFTNSYFCAEIHNPSNSCVNSTCSSEII